MKTYLVKTITPGGYRRYAPLARRGSSPCEVGGNWFNWYWAHSKGYYWGEFSLLAPAIGFIGLYFLIFPKEFAAQYTGKLSVRTWIAIILALALGFANMFAFDHGLY